MAITRKNKSTRKSVHWAGWSKIAPSTHQRTVMKRKCGKKCFLGPKKSFPVCAKNTCKISTKGLWAAYIRAKEWGKKKSSYKGKTRPTKRRSVYTKVAKKAQKQLTRRGQHVGK